jgi:hypothetical protein
MEIPLAPFVEGGTGIGTRQCSLDGALVSRPINLDL